MGLDMYLTKAKGRYDHEMYAKVCHLLSVSRLNVYNQVAKEFSTTDDPTDVVICENFEKRFNMLYDEKEHEILTTYGLSKDFRNSSDHVDVVYWRKHADLNEYFTSLYYKKTPEAFQVEEFNLTRLILTKEDILELIEKIKQELAKPGSVFEEGNGFFWGETDLEDWKYTLDKLNMALETTDFENETLYYECWY